MKNVLLQRAMKLNKNSKYRKWWQRAVRTMAMVVVFCTTYALILPAITMEGTPACGLEEHTHSDSCYKQETVVALECGLDDQAVIVHSHEGYCYDTQGTLICTLSEKVVHTHDESCITRAETPNCAYVHVHSETCTGVQKELTCGKEESQGHVHGDSCITTQQTLVCTEEETELHVHGESCYETTSAPCQLPESEGHTHTEECYTLQEKICDKTTNDGHVHEASCYPEVQMHCQLEQFQLHVHEETCYGADGTLTCTLPVVIAHQHTEKCCVATEQRILICGMEEHFHEEACYSSEEETAVPEYLCGQGVHAHVDTCYDAAGNLICTIPEHAHEAVCIVADLDLTADVETAEQWKNAIAELTLSGDWAQDVLTVAQAQLGYRESVKNVVLKGTELKGYTRYGAKYGVPYDDWSTLFVRFCLEYAGVKDYPVHSDGTEWVKALELQQMFTIAGEYEPQPGDLVFFGTDLREEPDGELKVDAVGIVSEVISSENGENAKFKTIQGDVDGKVDNVTWEQTDPAILGYAILPEPVPVCTLTEHTHSKECIDEGMNVICGLTEHIHDAQCGGLAEEVPEEQPEQDTILTCTVPEHTHEETCMDAETGALLCTIAEHVHTEQCYSLAETLLYGDLPLVCTVAEHIHGDSCFDAETGELLCTEMEHTHTSECYGPAEAVFTYKDNYVVLEVKVTSTRGLPEGMTMEVTGLSEQDQDFYESFAYANAQGELFGLTGYQLHFYANGREVMIPDAQVTANLTILPVEYQAPQMQTFSLRSLLSEGETETGASSDGETEQENTVLVTVLQRGETDVSESGTASFGADASGEAVVTLSMSTARSFALVNQSVVNPEFTVQYYAHFPQMQYSTTAGGYALDVIDTRGDGDGKPNEPYDTETGEGDGQMLPHNGMGSNNPGTQRGLLYLQLEKTDNLTDQMAAAYDKAGKEMNIYKVKTELTLMEVYSSETYTYSSGMNILSVDKLHQNAHYKLSEIWVSDDKEETWTVYTEDPDHWVQNEENKLWTHQEKNSSGASYDVFTATVTSVVGMGELHDVTFTNNSNNTESVLISDQSTVRMVYDLATGTQNVSANFFDYDISDTQVYTSYDSNLGDDKVILAKEYDNANDARYVVNNSSALNGNIYMKTSDYGINSVGAYIGAGSSFNESASYFAFGNQNTGVIHRYDTLNGYYINGGNPNSFKSCSFGLVKGLIPNTQILEFADGIVHQALFNDEMYYGVSVPGKTTYARQRLNFSRTGDTYVLTSVNGGNDELGNGVSENQLNEFIHPGYAWNADPSIQIRQFANNFWPLDGTTSDTVGTHDMEFGYYNEDANRYYVGTTLNNVSGTSYFPDSDDGNAHNSYFGMEFAVDFQLDGEYCGPLEYLFYGDDDMWVFLTNLDNGVVHQICDIGGVHGSVGSFTDLWDYIPKGEEGIGNYRLNFYYTERGASGSSCYMEFTLPAVTSVTQNIPQTGSVSVEKEVPNAEVSASETFEFLFELSGSKDNFAYEIETDGYTEASTGTISSGETFSLKAGQKITIVGIPQGQNYTITEQLRSDQLNAYSVSWTGESTSSTSSVSGTIVNGVTHSYTCVNEALGSLEVEKHVSGKTNSGKFKIDVTLTDSSGAPLSGTFGGYTFDTDGKVTVELGSGEKALFTGIPTGTSYTVVEQLPDGYHVRYMLEDETINGEDGKPADKAVGTVGHKTAVSILVINETGYKLPETGGSGTFLFTFGGLLMIAAACVYFAIQIERKYRKGVMFRKE